MIQIQRINVLFIYVADLPRAQEFYGVTLGLGEPVRSTEDWIEYQLPGGTNLALHRTTPEALDGSDPGRNTIGFSMEVSDVDSAFAELSARGVDFIRPPEQGPDLRLTELLDPEGNAVRLVQFQKS